MSVFHRSNDGFEHTEPNRREVLLAAGGLAAATAIAANGSHTATSHVGDKRAPQTPHVSLAIDDTRLTATVEVIAFSWGASFSGSAAQGGGGAVGKANVQDLSVTKYLDATSPRLFAALASGRHLRRVTLTWVGAKGAPTVAWTLDDVIVSSISEGGSSTELRLTENISLNFSKITVAYEDVKTTFDIARSVVI